MRSQDTKISKINSKQQNTQAITWKDRILSVVISHIIAKNKMKNINKEFTRLNEIKLLGNPYWSNKNSSLVSSRFSACTKKFCASAQKEPFVFNEFS